MIDRKVAMRRIGACVVGGAVFSLPLLIFMQFEPDVHFVNMAHQVIMWDTGFYHMGIGPKVFAILEIVGIGAAIGVLPGIAWAIDQKSARRRFFLWSILGVVIGYISAQSTHNVVPWIVFSVVGVYIGSFSALKSLGVFEAKDQRTFYSMSVKKKGLMRQFSSGDNRTCHREIEQR